MSLPFINFTRKDWILWGSSLIVVLISNLLSPEFNAVILIAALIGVTSLIFAAKGNVWSAYIWFKNPSEKAGEVKISSMTRRKWTMLLVLSVIVTAFFFIVLKNFDTPNLVFSTLSISTSFLAAALTILRTSYFALFYALNDLVLIVLWIMATIASPIYFPVIINFVIFFINDAYGFVSWKRREKS